MFRNKIRFCDEELLAPRPTPKLEDHPFSAVLDCLFNTFAATLHVGGRFSICNLRTRHAVVTDCQQVPSLIHSTFCYSDAFQAMAQAVTAETRLRSRASLCDRIGLGQVLLSPVLLFSPVGNIPPMLHTHFI
jgi:hypothetical protein